MPAKVLIIEDDPASLELLSYMMSTAGHTIVSATDGAIGLRLALEADPDLILCDLQLPELDGYEIIRRLNSHAGWKRVPVAAVTALSMPGDRESALLTGFDAYITKPIVPETFVREVEGLLPAALRSGSG